MSAPRGNNESLKPRMAEGTDAPHPSNDWLEEALDNFGAVVIAYTRSELLHKPDEQFMAEGLNETCRSIQSHILDLRIADAEKYLQASGGGSWRRELTLALADLRAQQEALNGKL